MRTAVLTMIICLLSSACGGGGDDAPPPERECLEWISVLPAAGNPEPPKLVCVEYAP